jgi:hypothetical protein
VSGRDFRVAGFEQHGSTAVYLAQWVTLLDRWALVRRSVRITVPDEETVSQLLAPASEQAPVNAARIAEYRQRATAYTSAHEALTEIDAMVQRQTAELQAFESETVALAAQIRQREELVSQTAKMAEAAVALREQWITWVTKMRESVESMIGNVLLHSVTCTLLGPFSQPTRSAVHATIGELLKPRFSFANDFRMSTNTLLHNSESVAKKLHLLPLVSSVREIGAFIIHAPFIPLVIDPSAQVFTSIVRNWCEPEDSIVRVLDLLHEDFVEAASAHLSAGLTILAVLDSVWNNEAISWIIDRFQALQSQSTGGRRVGLVGRVSVFVTTTSDPSRSVLQDRPAEMWRLLDCFTPIFAEFDPDCAADMLLRCVLTLYRKAQPASAQHLPCATLQSKEHVQTVITLAMDYEKLCELLSSADRPRELLGVAGEFNQLYDTVCELQAMHVAALAAHARAVEDESLFSNLVQRCAAMLVSLRNFCSCHVRLPCHRL